MDLGIAGIPQRVESSAPGGNVAQRSKTNKTKQAQAKRCHKDCDKECLELASRNGRSYILDKTNKLYEAKNTYTSDVRDMSSQFDQG